MERKGRQRFSAAAPHPLRLRVVGCSAALLVLAMALATTVQSQSRRPPPVRRARPPVFDDRQTRNVFFDDVFQVLQGQRPAAQEGIRAGADPGGDQNSAAMTTSPAGPRWSDAISAASLEDEVKILAAQLAEDLANPGRFQRETHQQCRRHFTMLAVLFTVAGQYDRPARWRREGVAAGRLFSRAASQCQAGSAQAYQQAKLRLQDLQDLLAGGGSAHPGEPAPDGWEDLADRATLMQRLEQAEQAAVQPGTANQRQFETQRELLRREGEIVTLIARALLQTGMEDAEDEQYQQYAQQMGQAARSLVEAITSGQYEPARTSAGQMSQSCSLCHQTFRG